MVVTSSYFSAGAIKLARTTDCDLVDRDILTEWILDFQSEARTQPASIGPVVVSENEGRMQEVLVGSNVNLNFHAPSLRRGVRLTIYGPSGIVEHGPVQVGQDDIFYVWTWRTDPIHELGLYEMVVTSDDGLSESRKWRVVEKIDEGAETQEASLQAQLHASPPIKKPALRSATSIVGLILIGGAIFFLLIWPLLFHLLW